MNQPNQIIRQGQPQVEPRHEQPDHMMPGEREEKSSARKEPIASKHPLALLTGMRTGERQLNKNRHRAVSREQGI
jgi:hypothetical protein